MPGSLSLSARPAAQLTQLVALSDAAGVRVPFGHRVAPTLLEYRPASHSIQGVPTSLSSSAQPATHFSQLVALSDRGGAYVPFGHTPTHAVAPTASERSPASQSVHGVPGSLSSSARPATHISQLVALDEPTAEYVPTTQMLHSVVPSVSENCPLAHATHPVNAFES